MTNHPCWDEVTLGLEDFICREKISSKQLPCPSNNAGMVTAKKDDGNHKADKPTVTFGTPAESKSEANTRPCVGHLGSALGAATKDGQPYACKFGKGCVFKHVPVDGKSKQKLLDIVGSLTSVARADLTRAVMKRP